MGDDCKDCIQVKNLEDKIRALWHAVNEIKEQNRDFEKRATDLERASDVTEEKFDRIFTAIGSIEKNIEKIANSIEQMQMKGSKTYENLKYEVIKYVVLAVTAIAAAKLF
jgi:septal ring factor EnvC (AmiA/AmiB activator)